MHSFYTHLCYSHTYNKRFCESYPKQYLHKQPQKPLNLEVWLQLLSLFCYHPHDKVSSRWCAIQLQYTLPFKTSHLWSLYRINHSLTVSRVLICRVYDLQVNQGSYGKHYACSKCNCLVRERKNSLYTKRSHSQMNSNKIMPKILVRQLLGLPDLFCWHCST